MSGDNIAEKYIKYDRAPEPWEASYRENGVDKNRNQSEYDMRVHEPMLAPKNSLFSGLMEGLREAQENPDYKPTSRIGKLIKGMMGLSWRDTLEGEADERRQKYPDETIGQPATTAATSGIEFRTIPAIPSELTSPHPVRAEPEYATSPALAAAQAMASGTNSREDVRTVEQGTIDLLHAVKAQAPNSSVDRALSILKADGNVTGNEYKVFQQLIARSGVDLGAVGISNAKDIDTTQELGAAMTTIIQQREQQSGRS